MLYNCSLAYVHSESSCTCSFRCSQSLSSGSFPRSPHFCLSLTFSILSASLTCFVLVNISLFCEKKGKKNAKDDKIGDRNLQIISTVLRLSRFIYNFQHEEHILRKFMIALIASGLTTRTYFVFCSLRHQCTRKLQNGPASPKRQSFVHRLCYAVN